MYTGGLFTRTQNIGLSTPIFKVGTTTDRHTGTNFPNWEDWKNLDIVPLSLLIRINKKTTFSISTNVRTKGVIEFFKQLLVVTLVKSFYIQLYKDGIGIHLKMGPLDVCLTQRRDQPLGLIYIEVWGKGESVV